MASHATIYGNAAYYDIAFSYRDYPTECAFLEEVGAEHLGHKASTFLEVAAGPANHAIEMARRGLTVTALDRTPGMVAYGREKAERSSTRIEYVSADMRRFVLPRRYDLAACLLGSWTYLLDNDAVLHHLDCVAEHLVEGGLYLIEMDHPRDVFTRERSTVSTWEIEDGDTTVRVTWGQPDDLFDPITQVRNVTVEFHVEDADGPRTWWESSPQRLFTANEIDALVRASGRFRILETYGGLSTKTPFGSEPSAWRMVPVLQKIS